MAKVKDARPRGRPRKTDVLPVTERVRRHRAQHKPDEAILLEEAAPKGETVAISLHINRAVVELIDEYAEKVFRTTRTKMINTLLSRESLRLNDLATYFNNLPESGKKLLKTEFMRTALDGGDVGKLDETFNYLIRPFMDTTTAKEGTDASSAKEL